MTKMSRLEVLAEYGYRRDPLTRDAMMETADVIKIRRIIGMAIDARAMVAVIGERGMGKTEAVEAAIRQRRTARVIRLQTPDRERALIGDIERAMMSDLTSEPIKRSREVRARQLRGVLGEASREMELVLVLDEAHRMHGQTFRALKTMREMEWMGRSPLFTVIMLGQYDPMHKRGVEEVRLRTDTVHLRGLTAAEIKKYITDTVGRNFDDGAVTAMTELAEARNFLELQSAIVDVMANALMAGRTQVSAIDVFEARTGGLSTVMKQLNITDRELAEATGYSRTTINQVKNGSVSTLKPETVEDVRGAISSVIGQRVAA